MRKALVLSLLVAAGLSVIVRAQPPTVTGGQNNNLTGCIGDQYVCDQFLQRKVEPKGVCSALNP